MEVLINLFLGKDCWGWSGIPYRGWAKAPMRRSESGQRGGSGAPARTKRAGPGTWIEGQNKTSVNLPVWVRAAITKDRSRTMPSTQKRLNMHLLTYKTIWDQKERERIEISRPPRTSLTSHTNLLTRSRQGMWYSEPQGGRELRALNLASEALVLIPAQLLTCFTTLDQFLLLSGPQFLYLLKAHTGLNAVSLSPCVGFNEAHLCTRLPISVPPTPRSLHFTTQLQRGLFTL